MNTKTLSTKKLLGFVFAILFLVLVNILPLPKGVERTALCSLGIFGFALSLWICDSVPMCIASFATMFIMPFFNVLDLNTVFTSFGGTSFFFAIATFAMSIALENTSVPLRICHVLVKWSKGNSTKLVVAFFFACGITSSIMSNLSTCIIYLGLVNSLLNANGCKPGKSGLGKCLMIGIPATAGCGGLITPSGTPGNILIISLLEGAGVSLSYLQWIMIFAPLALLTILICAIWSVTVFKPEKIDANAIETISKKVSETGKFTPKEKKTVTIILIMLVCWLLGTWVEFLNVTVVAMLGMVVMFLPGVDVLDWNEAAKKINWNLVFTLGSVGVIISGLTSTGIMDWLISKTFTSVVSWKPVLMLLVVGAVVCVIRAFIPTAPAIVALFGAPLLSIAAMTGMSPVTLLIFPAFWACCPMLLWFEPIFLFTYGYNYYKPQDVLKYGSIPSIVLIILMAFLPYYTGIMNL